MTTNDLLQALVRLRVETGSLACLGCGREHNCSTKGCRILREAADLIERLTAENVVLPDGQASAIESLQKEIEWKDMVIALAQRKQAEAEAERDALIEQIKERHDCLDCKHNDFCEYDGADDAIVFDCMNCVQEGCPCAGCCDSSRWEWRGLPEAPEEGDT